MKCVFNETFKYMHFFVKSSFLINIAGVFLTETLKNFLLLAIKSNIYNIVIFCKKYYIFTT